MTKKLLLVSALLVAPLSSAIAVDNVGGCGWGSKLFTGQQGLIPQVLAVTTNGTSGNQTFGITTGTSGCTQNGVVSSNWKTAMFIGNNMNKLARDMSVGNGEALDSLAALLDVADADKAAFNATLQQEFSSVFSSEEIRSEEVAENIKNVLLSSSSLSAYAANV
jgi:opacity protein-like surface antigen